MEISDSKTEKCLNCHEYFEQLKPLIKGIVVTKHFLKDAPDFNVEDILDSKHEFFTHLHKFEEKIDGNHIFRALKENMHFVYAVDRNYRVIFLRAFNNFKDYKRFLEDKKAIAKMIDSN